VAQAKESSGSLLFCGNSYLGYYRVNTSLAKEFESIASAKSSEFDLQDWGSFRKGGSTIAQRWQMSAEERSEMLTKHGQSNPERREAKITLPEVLKSKQFDTIILQQNSKARNVAGEAKALVQAAEAADMKVVLFMTWKGKRAPAEHQDRIAKEYLNAAKKLGVQVVPVGLVWQELDQEQVDVNLYVDGGHPSALAHYINALTLYAFLTDGNLDEIPLQPKRFASENPAQTENQVRDVIQRVLAKHTASN